MSTEADARMLIDKLLEVADWTITNKAQVSTEEASSDGRAEYGEAILKELTNSLINEFGRGFHDPTWNIFENCIWLTGAGFQRFRR